MSLQDGLIVHWTMDSRDVANGELHDRSGYGHHGSMSGGVSTGNTGMVGESFVLDGTDDRITSAATDTLKTQEHTVAFWVKPTNASNAEYEDLIHNGTGSTADDGTGGRKPHIYRRPDVDGWHWRVSTATEGNDGIDTADGSIDVNTWQHWAGVRIDGQLTLYKNGDQFANASITAGFGTGYDNFKVLGDDGMQSNIDDVRFYNRPLSAAEIYQLYNMRHLQRWR